MNVGAVLREARDRRGLSLDQVSHATKISVTILRNIEQNEIEKLPERVFLRGFLSAYAREVGLRPEATVQQYLGQFESTADVVTTPTRDASDASDPHKAGSTEEQKDQHRPVRVHWLLAAAMLAAIVGGSYLVARWRAPAPTNTTSVNSAIPVAAAQSSPTQPTPAAAARLETATTGSRDNDIGTAADGNALHIEIRPRSLCWLSATIDGRRVVYRLMQAGEQQAIDMHDEAVLRVGDAGAFAFSINGSAGRPLGRAGEAVAVHITRQNYREFLRRW